MRQRLVVAGILAFVMASASGCMITERRARAEVRYFVEHGVRKPTTTKDNASPPIERPMLLELTDLWLEYGDRLVPAALERAASAATEEERVRVINLLATDDRWAPRPKTYRKMLEALYSGDEFTSYAGQIIIEQFLMGSYPDVRTKYEALADIEKGLTSPYPWVRINCCGLLVRNTERRAKPVRELRRLAERDPVFLVRLLAASQLCLLDVPGKDQHALDALATRNQTEPPFVVPSTREARTLLEDEIVTILKDKNVPSISPVLPPYILRGREAVDLRIYVMQVARIVQAEKAIPVIRELANENSGDLHAEAVWVLKNWRWRQETDRGR